MTTTQLPNKLSALLRLAVADAQKCEADPQYELEMALWHYYDEEDDGEAVCKVCLAGSIMAKTLGVSVTGVIRPHDFDDETANKLIAVDAMRTGDFWMAARSIDTSEHDVLTAASDFISGRYVHALGRAELADYLKAASILEGAGL